MIGQQNFKISEFARLAQVSVRLLHHYDRIGLFKPRYVDTASGYRQYSIEQLPGLYHILALKALGFSLDEIAVIQLENSSQEIRKILSIRQAELEQRIAQDQARLRIAQARLQGLDEARQGTGAFCDVVIKSTPAFDGLSLQTDVSAAYPTAAVFRMISDSLCHAGLLRHVSSVLCIYHHHRAARRSELEIQPLPIEAIFVLPDHLRQPFELPDGRWLQPRHYEGFEQVATLLHHGADETRHTAHWAMTDWLALYGCSLIAPVREVYYRRGEPQNYLTEIQFPLQSGASSPVIASIKGENEIPPS